MIDVQCPSKNGNIHGELLTQRLRRRIAERDELLKEIFYSLAFLEDSFGRCLSKIEIIIVQEIQSKIRKLLEEGR